MSDLPPLPEPEVLLDVEDAQCPACYARVRFVGPIKLGYTADQMRAALEAPREVKPLTYKQIMDCAREADWPPSMISAFVQAKLECLARAIERKCAESWGVKLEGQG